MNLKESIQITSWDEVEKEVMKCYPKYLEGLKFVWDKVKDIEPDDNKDGMSLLVHEFVDGDETFIGVSGKKEGEKDSWSLSLSPWKEWLGCGLMKESLENFSIAQIVSHCFFEMTFYGFTEDKIKEQRDELDRRVAELDEDNCKTVSWDEMKKMIDEKE